MASKGEAAIDLDKHFEDPVPHQFLHGYLGDDPETRFTLLLPESDHWMGRLIQFLEGGLSGNEWIGPQDPGYYVIKRCGAAYVRSNHGHIGEDCSKIGYEGLEKVAHISNYRTMLCAREIMKKKYGGYPDFTYVFGSSGGGLRSTMLMEKYPETYNRAVAVVQAETSIIMYYASLAGRYLPILEPKYNEIVDATDAGGSGDPYAVLDTEEQRDALRKLYNAGFPRGAELQMRGVPTALFHALLTLTPEHVYYQDFWNKKGYAGYEGEVADKVSEGREGEVAEIFTMEKAVPLIYPKADLRASQPLRCGPKVNERGIPPPPPELLQKPVGFRGTGKFHDGQLGGYTVTFKSGNLEGKSFPIQSNVGDTIIISGIPAGYLEGIDVGDQYVLENRDFLSFSHYHRHIITLVEDTYRPADFLRCGKPMYLQRPKKAKEILKLKHFQTGDFKGKTISIFGAHDVLVWPPVLFNYLDLVKESECPDGCIRNYLVENGTHGPPATVEQSFRLASFNPMIGRALSYLLDWVEKDVLPPSSTVAELSSDYSLTMPKTAAERKGIQPVIAGITANGQSGSVRVRLGETVRFNGVAESPVGNIIRYEWYCHNLKDFYCEVNVEEQKASVNTPYTYIFQQPGIYFAVLRVTGDLGGDAEILGGGQRNLSRIRVIVGK